MSQTRSPYVQKGATQGRYLAQDAYDAGYKAAMEGKPLSEHVSSGYRTGYGDGLSDKQEASRG